MTSLKHLHMFTNKETSYTKTEIWGPYNSWKDLAAVRGIAEVFGNAQFGVSMILVYGEETQGGFGVLAQTSPTTLALQKPWRPSFWKVL